jgi:hypothetical protein
VKGHREPQPRTGAGPKSKEDLEPSEETDTEATLMEEVSPSPSTQREELPSLPDRVWTTKEISSLAKVS